jgi:CRP/FNR family transcriptional regulator, cyclic AMP receptor protein
MSFAAGTRIFEQGDKEEQMYVVKEGEVDTFINDFHLETVSPMASLANSASSIRKLESPLPLRELIALSRLSTNGTFYFLFRKPPVLALQVMKVTANRLRRVDALIAKADFKRTNQGAEG